MYMNPNQQQPWQQQQWQQPQMMQQQMPLPFDPLNPMSAQIPIQIGYAPFQVQVACSPSMQTYIGLVTSLLIAEIQSRVQANPLRMFMFNMYSRNGFQNEEFIELVDIAINYAEVLLMQRRAQSTDQAIRQAVSEVCAYAACGPVREYPAIQAYLNPQMVNEAQQGLQNMSIIVRQVMELKSRQMAPQFGMQQMQPGFGPGMMQTGFQQPGIRPGMGIGMGMGGTQQGLTPGQTGLFRSESQMTGRTQTQSAYETTAVDSQVNRQLERLRRQSGHQVQQQTQTVQQSQQQLHSRFITPTAAAVKAEEPKPFIQQPFRSKANHSPDSGYNANAIISEFGAGAKPTIDEAIVSMTAPTQPQVSAVNTQTTVQQAEVERKLYAPGEIKWVSTKEQPYLPAYNPRTHKIAFTYSDSGNVIAVLIKKTESEMNMMEYDQHAIGRVPTAPSRFPKKETKVNPDTIVTDKPEKLDEVNVAVSNRTFLETNEAAGAIAANIDAILSGKLDDVKNAVRTTIEVATPLTCDNQAMVRHYTARIEEISSAGNFDDAVRLLKSLNAPEDALLVNKVDAILTEELLNVLRVNLMLKVRIDSFIEDATALDTVLRNRFGDDVANALKNQEAKILARCVGSLSGEDVKEFELHVMYDGELPASETTTEPTTEEEKQAQQDKEDAKPGLAFLLNRVSYTHTAAYAYQLELALVDKQPALLTAEASPILYSMAVELFNDEEIRRNDYRRHYFVTKDGVRLQITRGYLNRSSYIVALA